MGTIIKKGFGRELEGLKKEKGSKLIHVFTHTDLDGVVSGEMLVNVYEGLGYRVTVNNCDYNNVKETVEDFIESGYSKYYERIYMTDISVGDEVTNEKIEKEMGKKFLLLDHHKTALWLNEKYRWSRVEVTDKEGVLTSGTSLIRDYLKREGILGELADKELAKNIEEIGEAVRLYDTWEWVKSGEAGLEAKRLNDILYKGNRDDFKVRLKETKMQSVLTKEEEIKIAGIEKDYKDLLERREKELIGYELAGGGKSYKLGVVFETKDVSELGNDLSSRNPKYDAILVVNGKNRKGSLRTRQEGVDVSILAKEYGGGGHPKASGLMIPEGIYIELLKGYIGVK